MVVPCRDSIKTLQSASITVPDTFSRADFSGVGEPLLHPDLADWITEAKHAGCKAGFLTNGSLLDEATASRMIQAGVDWIALSADGARAETFEGIRT